MLDRAVGAHALGYFHHPLEQHLRLDDVPGKDLRPRLITDLERVAKAVRGHQQRARAVALEQRVGRDRGAHLDRADALARDRRRRVRARAGRGSPARRRRGRLPGYSDRSLCATREPSGARPITSVNVPPRSIQKSQVPAAMRSPRRSACRDEPWSRGPPIAWHGSVKATMSPCGVDHGGTFMRIVLITVAGRHSVRCCGLGRRSGWKLLCQRQQSRRWRGL